MSFLIAPELVRMNAVFYPIYFIFGVVISIFATGANISAHRYDKTERGREDEIHSAMIVGVVLVLAIATLTIGFSRNLLSFLHVDQPIFCEFYVLAAIQFALFYILDLVIQKPWYVGKNKTANIYFIVFNSLIFVSTVGSTFAAKPISPRNSC
jgi:hypothetical protein